VNTEADPKAGPRRPVTRYPGEVATLPPLFDRERTKSGSVHPAGPITRTLHDVTSRAAGPGISDWKGP